MAIAVALLSMNLGCGRGGNCKPEGRYLVVTPWAGMGNRLRTIASAKIMAGITDRKLVIDWRINPKEMPGQWYDFFLTPLTFFDESDLYLTENCTLTDIKKAKPGDPYVLNLGSPNDIEATKRLKKIPADKEAVVYFATSMPFEPAEEYLSDADYNERRRTFFHNLDPVLRVQKAVKQFKKDNKFDEKFMIGVHYRTWNAGPADVKQGNENLTRDLGAKYLQDFIDKMKAAVAEPLSATDNKPVAFFLATDNEEVKKKMMAEPTLAGKILTYDFEKIERDTVKGQQDALIDFFLLGSTNYIIGTYQSSMSDEAAHLTKQDKKVNVGDPAYH